jgi:alcohol dehydrogenase class IV
MALHHRICHVLGGRLNLPHAETHAVVLPHALAYNAPAVPEPIERIGRALGGEDDPTDAPAALHELARRTGAPTALRDLGMTAADIEPVVEDVLAGSGWNPRPIEPDGIRTLLHRAFDGQPPLEEGSR